MSVRTTSNSAGERPIEAPVAAELPVAAPAVGSWEYRSRVLRRLLRRPSGLAGVFLTATVIVAGVLAPILAPHDPFTVAGPSLSPPSPSHPMGTDGLGRDILSGVIFGTRTSLIVAAAVGAVVLVTGITVGTLSSWTGGWADHALMRFTELFQVLPQFFLAVVVLAFFGPGLLVLILVLGFTSWAGLARIVRAEVLSLKQREFIEAARASGASGARIVVREIVPNILPAATALLGLIMAQVILIEASLGFIGLGDADLISWGYLASQAQRFLLVAWWMSVFPGLAIVIAVLGLNLLSDALSDVLGSSR